MVPEGTVRRGAAVHVSAERQLKVKRREEESGAAQRPRGFLLFFLMNKSTLNPGSQTYVRE